MQSFSHPGLVDQLEPLLHDKTQNRVTRRFAVDAAEECREKGLLGALTGVALDQLGNHPHTRPAEACRAIVKIGTPIRYGN